MGITPLSTVIKRDLDTYTLAEKKVSRIILAEYPTAGLEPVAKLAAKAKVSAPTVLRFVDKLGFANYPAFQEHLISELKERGKSALEQYPDTKTDTPPDEMLSHCLDTFKHGLENSFADLVVAEFREAVTKIADPKKRVFCIGGRYSSVLAEYLCRHLQEIRPNCHMLANEHPWEPHQLIDMNRKDLIVVYDFRRYQESTFKFIKAAAQRNVEVILITDRYLSPVAEYCCCVLPVDIEGPAPFDSYIPAMAMTESLVAALVSEVGDKAAKRITELENLGSQLLDAKEK